MVAMAWQIYLLTDSPLQIGLLGLARAIPQMGLLLFGGLLADAIDRRHLVNVSQGTQTIVSVALVGLSITDNMTPEALYIGAALLALFTALETPTRQAVLPNLVPAADLSSALALNVTQRNIGSVIGPSLAGIALAFIGPVWCYAAEGVTRVVFMALLWFVRTELQAGTGTRGGITLSSLREGIGFVWTHPILLLLMLLDFGATIFGSARALLPVYARDILFVGATGLGLLFAAESIGSIVIGVFLSGVRSMRRAGLGVILGVALYGVCTVLFALSTNFWLSVLLLGGAGVGNTLSTVLRGTINQLNTPDELRGRVVGVNSIFTTGGPQLGQFESGLVADIWSTEISALSGGLATLVLAGAYAGIPLVRRYELGQPTIPSPRGRVI